MTVPSTRAVLASVMLVGGWVVAAHVAAVWSAWRVRRGAWSTARSAEQMRILMEAFRWLAIPITLLCHFGFSLPAWLSAQPMLEHSMTLQAAGLLAPGMILLVATWSAEFWFAAIAGNQALSLSDYGDAMMRCMRGGPAWLIVPALIFIALGDVADVVKVKLVDSSSWSDAQTDMLTWGLIGLGGMVLVSALPWLVRWIAKTEPVSAENRREIETWLRGCGISTHPVFGMQIARWDTGRRMLNAMVAGIVRPGRLLLLSDRLLDELPRGSRLMVVMHEVAHVRRHHLPIRMAAILPAWFVSSWSSSLLIESAVLNGVWGAGIGGVLGLITTIVTLGVVSHLSELDADAVACRLAVQACRRPAEGRLSADCLPGGDPWHAGDDEMTEELAAELLADALTRVTADHPASRKFSWLHPSLATRVGRLRRIARPLPDFTSDSHTLAV